MGPVGSKDTRRISFDNTFSLLPASALTQSIEDNVLDINAIAAETEKEDDLVFPEKKNHFEVQERNDLEVDYWANRIELLKKEHRIINEIIETEYEKTLDNATKLVQSSQSDSERSFEKIEPCLEWRAKILKCYENNPREPLICSPIVQAFSACVSTCREEQC